MRTSLPFSLLLLTTSGAIAQPVLTQFGNAPIGSSREYSVIDGTPVTTGASGAGITWDFSSLGTQATVQIATLDPSTTTFGASFPTADRVERIGNGTYFYYATGATYTDVVGFVDSIGALEVAYPNPWRVAYRPLAFGESHTDNLTRSYVSVGLNFNGTGTSTLDADAYGTLVLPTGTVNNVLRVHLVQHNVDSSQIGNVTIDLERTAWYVAGSPYAVMTIEHEVITSMFFNSERHTTMYMDASALGVPESHGGTGEWSLRPLNNDELQLTATTGYRGLATLRWFDGCGRLLHDGSTALVNGSAIITLPTNSTGPLLLVVNDGTARLAVLKWWRLK